jgi:hypothetical protein
MSGFGFSRGGFGFFGAGAGEAPPVDPADTLIDAMVTPPSAPRDALIRATVGDLIAAGLWDKLDCLHVFAAETAQAAGLNWIVPSAYEAVPINSASFTTNQGYTASTATGGHGVSIPFNPATDAVKMTASSMTMFMRNFTSQLVNTAAMGTTDVSGATSSLTMDVRTAAGNFRGRPIIGTLPSDIANANEARLVSMFRDGNTVGVYFAGSLGGSEANTLTVGLPNSANIGIGGNAVSTGTYSWRNNTRPMITGWGAYLDAGEQADLNTILEAYIAGL